MCIALNCFLYLCKWVEIMFDPNATQGAVTIAKHQAMSYVSGVFSLFTYSAGAVMSKHHYSRNYVIVMWLLGISVYIVNFYLW
jgi:hypothetical protein